MSDRGLCKIGEMAENCGKIMQHGAHAFGGKKPDKAGIND
jgi:hypothetical protein